MTLPRIAQFYWDLLVPKSYELKLLRNVNFSLQARVKIWKNLCKWLSWQPYGKCMGWKENEDRVATLEALGKLKQERQCPCLWQDWWVSSAIFLSIIVHLGHEYHSQYNHSSPVWVHIFLVPKPFHSTSAICSTALNTSSVHFLTLFFLLLLKFILNKGNNFPFLSHAIYCGSSKAPILHAHSLPSVGFMN